MMGEGELSKMEIAFSTSKQTHALSKYKICDWIHVLIGRHKAPLTITSM